MPRKIITHPDNLKYVRELFKEEFKKDELETRGFLHYINPFPAIQITENIHMDREKWTGKWKVLQSKYYSYWDGVGEPPSWCIYCGFVVKEMVPNFVEVRHDPIFCMDFGKIRSLDNRRILINSGV